MQVWTYIREAIRTHPFNAFTLLIALLAAAFAGWSALETRRIRVDAANAAKEQKSAVERSVDAAESSAKSAQRLADGMQQSARAAEETTNVARRQLDTAIDALGAEYRPVVEVVHAEVERSTINSAETVLSFELRNSGRGTAEQVYFALAHGSSEYGPDLESDIPTGTAHEVSIAVQNVAPNHVLIVRGQVTYHDRSGHAFRFPYCYALFRSTYSGEAKQDLTACPSSPPSTKTRKSKLGITTYNHSGR